MGKGFGWYVHLAFVSIGVLQINGDMYKHQKFAFIRLFMSAMRLRNYDPWVLFATSAANMGITQPLITFVLCVELTRCLKTSIQERGRNRGEGQFNVFTDWKCLVKLILTTLIQHKSSSKEMPEYKGP